MSKVVVELDLEAHKVIELHRKSLGQSHLDIIKSALRQAVPPAAGNAAATRRRAVEESPRRGSERQVGQFFVRVGARQTTCFSQKAAYKQVMEWLEEDHPGLFEQLSRQKTRRGRCIVARSPQALYARPGLDHLAEALGEDWYADTNLSKTQKFTRLRIACAEAGLTLFKEVDPGFR